MSRIIVTGGCGFLGSYLVKRLIESGSEVIVVDLQKSVGGISYVHPQSKFYPLDICNPSTYAKLPSAKYDAVYHLAAQSAGEPAYDDPKQDLLANAYSSFLVARYCKLKNVSLYPEEFGVYNICVFYKEIHLFSSSKMLHKIDRPWYRMMEKAYLQLRHLLGQLNL